MTDDLLRKGAAILAEAQIPDPQREARILWRNTPDEDADAFIAKVRKRAQRMPLSHILGYRDFYRHRFIVTGDVLDPRPDTETLVDVALEQEFATLLDLGTGSGCILLSLLDARGQATGVGTDISQSALVVAAQNCAALNLQARASFVQSNWLDAITGTFDLIVSNPPYIAAAEMENLQPEVRLHEPRMALTDEADGLTAYRRMTRDAPACLTRGGRLVFEIGPTQADAVAGLMKQAGFENIRVIPDLDGRDRVVVGSMPLYGRISRQ